MRPLSVVVLVLLLSGCVWVFRSVDTEALDPDAPPVAVESPLKVHFEDGSVAVFPLGAAFRADSLFGPGRRYGLDLSEPRPVEAVALEEVAALEVYEEAVNVPATILATTAATAVGVVGGVALFKALFGSCPTVYDVAGPDGAAVLEAELFSNSVAPLFEMRDTDRLHAQPDAAGRLALEVRNEALETHYLNHLELVEVRHAEGEAAYPAGDSAWVVRDARPVAAARDRAGRDVSAALAAADGDAYATAPVVLDAVTEADPMDHVDLVLPAPASDSAAVVLRLRNSLLSTVLFYEFMLDQQGARALDWIGRDLAEVGTVVEMGDFYVRRMGLRVEVRDGGTYREVGRVTEVGPIAWSDVAVPVPVTEPDSLRLRLRFVADAWRIDRAAVAGAVRRAPIRTHPLAGVSGAEVPDALERMGRADEAYHVTGPGDRFEVAFEPGPADGARTFFLAGQGYYIEWVRGEWVRDRLAGPAFRATD
ncbi:MAG: hypothetical protein R3362_07895, partial [Rhodothermales bacterium]|nr:hypothetical protein [Rhodothermales bacterium]